MAEELRVATVSLEGRASALEEKMKEVQATTSTLDQKITQYIRAPKEQRYAKPKSEKQTITYAAPKKLKTLTKTHPKPKEPSHKHESLDVSHLVYNNRPQTRPFPFSQYLQSPSTHNRLVSVKQQKKTTQLPKRICVTKPYKRCYSRHAKSIRERRTYDKLAKAYLNQ